MKKKSKHEIDKELKKINKTLREISRTLFWYLELPVTKLLELQKKEEEK